MDPDAAIERAGPVGAELAQNMVAKAIEVIDGFPDSSPEQRQPNRKAPQ